ncbi:MAG TPA: Zn-ribbon domain-containing OB-fold protein [Terriglobales bacterium]|nr:Zn-ribbon domain-containing OB-fold protein [Terriglobales bacterium]
MASKAMRKKPAPAAVAGPPRALPASKPVYGKVRLPETDQGTVVFGTDPLVVKDHYEIDYLHSYAEDSPFFLALAQGKLLGSECTGCGYRFATPRAYCMECGAATRWFELPREGRVHTWTTCHFGSEAFLKETPFNLALIEFDGVNTLLLTRLVGATEQEMRVGMAVKARFRRLAQFKPTDVYFVPADR